jgi:pentatricopeptide repeat protein
VFLKLNLVDHVKNLYHVMVQRHVAVDIKFFSTLIEYHAHALYANEVMMWLDELARFSLDMTLSIYAHVIEMFGKMLQPEGALFWFNKAKESYVGFGVDTYTVFIEMYAVSLFFFICIVCCFVRCLCILSVRYGKMNNAPEALYWFDRLTYDGVIPKSRTYMTTIGILTKHKQEAAAMRVFEAMIEAKIQPTAFVFSYIIEMFRALKKPKEALDVLQSMAEHKVQPTVAIYNVIIGIKRSRRGMDGLVGCFCFVFVLLMMILFLSVVLGTFGFLLRM